MQNSRIPNLVECVAKFKFASFSKVIIYVYRYQAINIYCTDRLILYNDFYWPLTVSSWFYNCSRNIYLLCRSTFNHKKYNFLDCDWLKKTLIFHLSTCQVDIGQFVI